MLDPATDSFSPVSRSSISSSDLDTESTGSFFHERSSTTLGNLMGVSLQTITFRARASAQPENPISVASGGRASRKPKKIRVTARRRWWMLCSNEGDCRRASLGDFLEVERRFGQDCVAVLELEEGIVLGQPRGNGRELFSDGRVLPPAAASPTAAAGHCRFSAIVAVERWCNLCSAL